MNDAIYPYAPRGKHTPNYHELNKYVQRRFLFWFNGQLSNRKGISLKDVTIRAPDETDYSPRDLLRLASIKPISLSKLEAECFDFLALFVLSAGYSFNRNSHFYKKLMRIIPPPLQRN